MYGTSLITGMILWTGLGTGYGTCFITGTITGFGIFTGTGTGYGLATGTCFGTCTTYGFGTYTIEKRLAIVHKNFIVAQFFLTYSFNISLYWFIDLTLWSNICFQFRFTPFDLSIFGIPYPIPRIRPFILSHSLTLSLPFFFPMIRMRAPIHKSAVIVAFGHYRYCTLVHTHTLTKHWPCR